MRGRKVVAREFAENFLAGGFLVLAAVLAADVSGPVAGGVIAGLPLRFAATWLIAAARKGGKFAEDMARGSLRGMAANILSSVCMFALLYPLGFLPALLAGVIICMAAVAALRLTFPE